MVIVLSGCSIAVDNVPDSKPDLVSESSQDSVTSSSEALSHLRRNPVPGSIEKFVNLHGVTKFNLTENDELVFSSSNSKSIFTPDYSQGTNISASRTISRGESGSWTVPYNVTRGWIAVSSEKVRVTATVKYARPNCSFYTKQTSYEGIKGHTLFTHGSD